MIKLTDLEEEGEESDSIQSIKYVKGPAFTSQQINTLLALDTELAGLEPLITALKQDVQNLYNLLFTTGTSSMDLIVRESYGLLGQMKILYNKFEQLSIGSNSVISLKVDRLGSGGLRNGYVNFYNTFEGVNNSDLSRWYGANLTGTLLSKMQQVMNTTSPLSISTRVFADDSEPIYYTPFLETNAPEVETLTSTLTDHSTCSTDPVFVGNTYMFSTFYPNQYHVDSPYDVLQDGQVDIAVTDPHTPTNNITPGVYYCYGTVEYFGREMMTHEASNYLYSWVPANDPTDTAQTVNGVMMRHGMMIMDYLVSSVNASISCDGHLYSIVQKDQGVVGSPTVNMRTMFSDCNGFYECYPPFMSKVSEAYQELHNRTYYGPNDSMAYGTYSHLCINDEFAERIEGTIRQVLYPFTNFTYRAVRMNASTNKLYGWEAGNYNKRYASDSRNICAHRSFAIAPTVITVSKLVQNGCPFIRGYLPINNFGLGLYVHVTMVQIA